MGTQNREESASAFPSSGDPVDLFPRTDAWRKALRMALEAPNRTLTDASGETSGLGISISESSELSRWMTQLQARQPDSKVGALSLDDLYRRIANATHEGIWLVNREGRTVFVNASLASLLGYRSDDMMDRSFVDFVPDYARKRAAELLNAKPNAVLPRMRADLLKCDGTIVNMMASMTVIQDDQGELFGMLAMLTDITELRHTQESILAAHEGLERKIQERTQALAEANARLKEEAEAREAAMLALRESEERHRLLAENSLDMLSSHSIDGTYLYASPASLYLMGYEPDELVGRNAFAFMHEEDVAIVENVQAEIMYGGIEQTQVDYRKMHRDGHWIWFESKIRVIRDEKSGKPIQLIVNSRDITDRKEVERELRQVKVKLETRVQERTEALTRSMLALRMGNMERRETEKQLMLLTRAIASAGQGIVVTDPEVGSNKIIYANPAFYQLTGFEPEEVIGVNCRFLQGPLTQKDQIARIRQAIRDGKPFTGELTNYRKDGSHFWNSLRINPIVDADGEISNFVGVLTDITESRELEDRLQQARKMESLGTLAGGVAHDFNNMLTPILGYSVLLLQTANLAPEHRNWISTMARTAKRSRELVSQILAFTRQKAQQRTRVDLHELVEETLSIVRAGAPSRVRILSQVEQGPFFVNADSTQLHQAVLNLATNAVYELQKSGGELTLTIKRVHLSPGSNQRWGRELMPGPYVQLSVRDNGGGIPPKVLARIWEPFVTTKPGDDGTGMGLPEVLGIVTAHEGAVAVESNEGVGTCFDLVLPLDLRAQAELGVGPRAEHGLPSAGGGQTLMLVEDEEVVLEVMADMLVSLNYQVLSASSGAEARTLFEANKDTIDLVLTDQSLPDSTGIAVIRHIREQGSTLPVLIYTGNPAPSLMQEAKELKVHEVLSKPVDMAKLGQTLERCLKK